MGKEENKKIKLNMDELESVAGGKPYFEPENNLIDDILQKRNSVDGEDFDLSSNKK
jgi:hypothetical protein